MGRRFLLLFLRPCVGVGQGYLNRTLTNQVEMTESVSSFLKFLCCQRSPETEALIDNQ